MINLKTAQFSSIFTVSIAILMFYQWQTAEKKLETPDQSQNPLVKNQMECFKPPKNWSFANITLFENMITQNMESELSKSIFFHETSCFKTGVFDLNAR